MKGRIVGDFFMGQNLIWHLSVSAADKRIVGAAYLPAVGPACTVAF